MFLGPAPPDGAVRDATLPYGAVPGVYVYKQLAPVLRAYEADRGAWLAFAADYPHATKGAKYFLLVRNRGVATFLRLLQLPDAQRHLHEVVGGSETHDAVPHKFFVDFDMHGGAGETLQTTIQANIYAVMRAAVALWGEAAAHVVVLRAPTSPNFHAVFYRVRCTGLQGPSSVASATHQLGERMHVHGDYGAAAGVDRTFHRGKLLRTMNSSKADGTQALQVFDGPWHREPWICSSIKARASVWPFALVNFFDHACCLDGMKHVAAAKVQRGRGGRGGRGRSCGRRSPYPAIDAYITRYLASLKPAGKYRRVDCDAQRRTLTYYVIGNRCCAGIGGRAHRSNNIILAVDVASGTVRQRCFNETKCRGFESAAWPLPADCRASAATATSAVASAPCGPGAQ